MKKKPKTDPKPKAKKGEGMEAIKAAMLARKGKGK